MKQRRNKPDEINCPGSCTIMTKYDAEKSGRQSLCAPGRGHRQKWLVARLSSPSVHRPLLRLPAAHHTLHLVANCRPPAVADVRGAILNDYWAINADSGLAENMVSTYS